MTAKKVEVNLSVGAVMAVSEPLRRGAKQVGKFQKEVEGHLKKLENIKGATRAIQAFEKVNAARIGNNKKLDKARQTLKKYHQELQKGGKITQKQRDAYNKQARIVADLENKQSSLSYETANAARQMDKYGVSIKDVAGAKKRLLNELDQEKSAIKQNTAAWEAHNRKMAAAKKMRANMDAAYNKAQSRFVTGVGLMYTGRQITRSLYNPIKAAMNAEEAFADVRKVVDFAGSKESEAFQAKIVELSKSVPMSISQLYQLVAAAGQAGIPKDKLIEFTQIASRVGVAFDVSADQAGDSLAGMRTALGLSLEELELYMDGINHLSNNMASSAPDLLNFAQRTLGDFKGFGLAKEEALAFGSAMLAVKVPVDVAATSFRNMGKMLARGKAATKSQRKGLRALGLNAEKVSKSLQTDAVGTIFDVLERLQKLSKDRQSSVRSQIFGDEARGLGTLAQNLDVLREAMALMKSTDSYGGSAMGEYANRIETSAAKLQIFHNQMDALRVNLGKTLLPLFNDTLEKLGDVVNWISKLSKDYPGLAKGLGVAVGSAGALVAASGLVVNTIAAAGILNALRKGGWYAFGDLMGKTDTRIGSINKKLGVTPSLVGKTLGVLGTLYAAKEMHDDLPDWSDGFKKKAREEQAEWEKSNPVLANINRLIWELKEGVEGANRILGPRPQDTKSRHSNSSSGSIPGGEIVESLKRESDRFVQSGFAEAVAVEAGAVRRSNLGSVLEGQGMAIRRAPIAQALNEKIAQIRAASSRIAIPSVGGSTGPGAPDKKLAGGGDFDAGDDLLVGEKGPERVTFGKSGHVTPNHELGARFVKIAPTIHVHGMSPDEARAMVAGALADMWRDAGMSSFEDEDIVTS